MAPVAFFPGSANSAVPSNGSTAGKIMNHDYRITAEKHDFAINYTRGDDLSNFPIEQARLRSIWYMLALATGSVAGYGWALHAKTVCLASDRGNDADCRIIQACGRRTGAPSLHRDCNNRHFQHLWHALGRSASGLSVSRERTLESDTVLLVCYWSCRTSNYH